MSELSDLRERVANLERKNLSHSEDMRRVYERFDAQDEHLVRVEKMVLDHDGEITPARERRAKFADDRRFVVRAVTVWATLAGIALAISIFSAGFRGLLIKWLAALG